MAGKVSGMDEIPQDVHGTLWGYQRGCRSECCRAAKRRRAAQDRERYRELAKQYPERVPHGTIGGYTNWSCRCLECRTALRVTISAIRARKKQDDES